jgi:putative phosphoribosyl transferase
LTHYADRSDLIVLGLPRGGVPVAFEVAHALHAPLDVFVVRKLGTPGQSELAMGAIATGGVRVLDPDIVRMLGISKAEIQAIAAREERELERRESAYRGERPAPSFAGRTVILVDDGLATGSTMRAGIQALRQQDPARIVAAVPVAALETCRQLEQEADEMVCAVTPQPFRAVGLWYADFSQTTDAEVRELLSRAATEFHAGTRLGRQGQAVRENSS